MAHRIVVSVLLAGLMILALALWRKDVLPEPQELREELLEEPKQLSTQRPALQTTVGGIRYAVRPLFSYDLYGLVVSRHDSRAWWDYVHKEWNDQLNVADLCVVWGKNARNGSYREMSFSSGQFVCYFNSDTSEALARFDTTAASNNHLLTDDPQLARIAREVRVGDQVHFRGYLAEYSHSQGSGFQRGTSTVRTDTGDRSCETVYLDDIEILQRGGGPWHALRLVAVAMLLLSVVAWFALPHRVED